MRSLLSAAVILALAGTAGPALAISDESDFQPMYSALKDLMGFAAPGRSVNWGNPQTGNHGEITALQRADRDGMLCWAYERTYSDRGAIYALNGVTCELEPGLWQIVDEGAARLAEGAPAEPSPPAQATAPAQTAARPPATAEPAPQGAPPDQAYDGYTVRETQKMLSRLGYDPGPIDGAFGGKTRSAIEEFERDHGYPTSGEPSPSLIARLREAVDGMATPAPEQAATGTTGGADQSQSEPPKLLMAEPPEPPLEPPPQASAPAPGTPGSGSGSSGLAPPPPPPPPPAQ